MARTQHNVQVSATPEQVWAQLQKADIWSGLSGISAIKNATHTGDLLTGFDFSVTIAGTARPGRAEATKQVVNERMDLGVNQRDLDLHLSVRLEGATSATQLSVVLQAEPKSFMLKMAWGVVVGVVEAGFPGEVEEFGKRIAAAAQLAPTYRPQVD
jgi:hypothetical protein